MYLLLDMWYFLSMFFLRLTLIHIAVILKFTHKYSLRFLWLAEKLSKKESLSSDQLWKMNVLLTIISRINDEYKRYLKTREYECIETII